MQLLSCKVWLFMLVFCIANVSYAQYQLSGEIIDQKTKAPLAFVNIVANNEKQGTSTGIDGKFTIKSDTKIHELKLSYVGYKPKVVEVSNNNFLSIELSPTSYKLNTVEILPGFNPAHRIINKVVQNRKKHNPEKSLNFSYQSYNKLYFTAKIDSSILNNPDKISELDTSDQKAIKWLDKQHLFMMESVTERNYKLPDKNFEKVIASRVSGLKNPTFSLLATELQSFSFYNSLLEVGGKTYINPVSKNTTNNYFFYIEDTTYRAKDTVFVISFRPKKNKNFDGLKGLLYINTSDFAIQNVIAEPVVPQDGLNIKIQQQYQKIEGSWFPIQLNTFLILDFAQVNNYKLMGVGKSYLKNIKINPEISNKVFSNIEVEIDKNANNKDDAFWNEYRNDTLSAKEQKTYQTIDSIGKAENFDAKLKWIEALSTGKINWGYIDFDLNRFVNYTDYQGVRLGAGIHTSNKLSDWFKIGGYGAYGFKDKAPKYGGDVNFVVNKRNNIELNVAYMNDVAEPGSYNFYGDVKGYLNESYRNLYISRENNTEKIEARLMFRTLRYLKVYAFANQDEVDVTNNYYYIKPINENINLFDNNYLFNEVGVGFRYAYKEKVLKSINKTYSLGTKYPILYAKITQGITNFEGDFKYTRLTFKTKKSFTIKKLGKSSFLLESGLTNGTVPHHKLFSLKGVFTPQKFAISVQNSFETMLPYEFIADRFAALYFRHSFQNLLIQAKKFKPVFVLATNIGVGQLSNKQLHQGITFNTLEKGYYESGLIIDNLLKLGFSSFGVATFYRYGPYHLNKTADNIAVKLSYNLSF